MNKNAVAEEKPVAVDDSKLEAVIETMPPVNPDLEKEPEVLEESAYDKLTDKHGRKFDPKLHEVDRNGKPKINKKDGFITCKPGRTAKRSTRDQLSDSGPALQPGPDIDAINRKMSAEASVDIFLQVGMMVFGSEWQPVKTEQLDERMNLILVTDRYFEHKGIKDVPPGAALAVALIGYAAARMQYPTTQTRMNIILGSLKKSAFGFFSGFGKFFKKIKGFRNGAQSDTRSHGVGQDNAGKEAGEKIPG